MRPLHLCSYRHNQNDFLKEEKIYGMKRDLLEALDRYQHVIFLVQQFYPDDKKSIAVMTPDTKFDRIIAQITSIPRVKLIQCYDAEQMAKAIVFFMKKYQKHNKNQCLGVKIPQILRENKEKEIRFLYSFPRLSFPECLNMLSSLGNTISSIVNATEEKLLEAAPSLLWDNRQKWIKKFVRYEFRKSMEWDCMNIIGLHQAKKEEAGAKGAYKQKILSDHPKYYFESTLIMKLTKKPKKIFYNSFNNYKSISLKNSGFFKSKLASIQFVGIIVALLSPENWKGDIMIPSVLLSFFIFLKKVEGKSLK
ncbi:hypothetical protein RFI_11235 [Reticulomyxa filosa]|uniref:Uncharacterized protein n=1 Tax=Reticulomyxa filosa TaxID=46433 RepID=X6NIW4_RETFI|nr:hypothetical protein RFI_11235 [Reticulomyxa filosa]|eukprot:ETO25901.1 hypothetical protein RFI_11235 [Reticulomyxa filosa]